MPKALRIVVEDIYANGISHSFLIAVPFAVISLIAILFLPNKPLTRMTTTERAQAAEADLATASVPEGMSVLTATGSVTLPDDDHPPGTSRRCLHPTPSARRPHPPRRRTPARRPCAASRARSASS